MTGDSQAGGGSPAPGRPATSPRAWNVCTGLSPALAGLHRGIMDFSRALDAPVISFGDATAGDTADPAVHHVPCGPSPPGYEGLVVGPAASRRAAALAADAELLVVHSLFRGHVGWAAGMARHGGRSAWFVPHGSLDPQALAHRPLVKRAWFELGGGRALAAAAVAVFATHRERDKATPWTFSRRTAVVPWPLPLPGIAERPAARLRFRRRLGIPEEAGILLSVGRLHSVKRPRETVAAFAAGAGPDDHLVMAGMDDDVTAARLRLAIPEPLRGRVHLPGPLHGAALHEARLAADGSIALSWKENFGYSLAEALAYELPVIVSPGHDLAWELPRDRTGRWPYGWLLPDDAPATAAAAVAEFARLRRERPEAAGLRRLSSARSWVAEELAPERFRERLLRLG